MRNRFIIPIMLLSVFFSSCTENMPSVPEERICVSFLALREETRASGVTGHESDICSIDVLVFRSGSGMLDCSGRSDSSGVNVSVLKGTDLTYHVFANAPAGMFDGIRTESRLLSVETLLEHNADSCFVMYGFGSEVFEDETPVEVRVGLIRYVCKVTLDEIVPAFVEDEPGEVRFRGAFILNACGSEPLSGVPTAGGLWYNRFAKDDNLNGQVADFVSADTDTLITDASAFSAGYSFYCLPNPESDGSGGSGITRLVLSFSVGGGTDFYPINIPSMESNCWYHIRRAVLNGPGSSDPDNPVEPRGLSLAVDIAPWGEPVSTGNITFD